MASGKLALVPRSTQRGDIIAPIYKNADKGTEFLFHPLQLVDEQTCVDAEVLELLMDTPPPYHKEANSNLPTQGRIGVEEWLVVHCELIGACFLDEHDSLGQRKFYSDSKDFAWLEDGVWSGALISSKGRSKLI